MLRQTALRSLRPLQQSLPSGNVLVWRSIWSKSSLRAPLTSRCSAINTPKRLSLAVHAQRTTSLVRYQSTIDRAAEAEYAKQKLQPTPETVSLDSSVRHVASEVSAEEPEADVDMMAGIKGDIQTIVDTFSLKDVPKEALYVGMAGVLPYLATSLSTVYLAFDIQYAENHGSGLLLSGEVAEQLLHIVEPIQLGYGATIISFLGAIHWGLEWAGFGGHQGYPRYAIGVLATAVAWPTLLLSAEIGLITQFLAFTFLYYVDSRAATRGWAPSWYPMYRFVLTFVVGASIVFSLIGRGQVADLVTKPPGPAERMKALRESQMDQLEREESERRTRIVQEDEAAEEEEEEEEEEAGEEDDQQSEE